MDTAYKDTYQKVLRAYNDKAKDFRKTDKRERWPYLASKMLSDHYLMHKINLTENTLLNIGCAPHPIDEIMYARKVKKWISSDINFNALKANRTISQEELSLKISGKIVHCCCDATKLGFADASLDVVVALSALEHIPEEGWKKAIAEIARILKPGGFAVITMSNKLNFPYYFWSLRQQSLPECEFGYERCIFPWQLRSQIVNAGMRPVEFQSNFWLTTSIWMRFVKIPFLKYFGMRMGYLIQKPHPE